MEQVFIPRTAALIQIKGHLGSKHLQGLSDGGFQEDESVFPVRSFYFEITYSLF